MFDRYNEKARRAIFFARYECSNYGSPNIESEHLLLGLLRETSLLQRLLKTGRESHTVLRKEIENQITRRPRIATSVEVSVSTECERILAFAAQESERLAREQLQPEHLLVGPWQVEPEHLLLGLVHEERCLGARILQAHEVTFSQVLEEVRRGRGGEARLVGPSRGTEWCCVDFQARCYQAGKNVEGIGILFFAKSKGTHFLLEYRHSDRTSSQPIAAEGLRLKFCPWCGCNLSEWYGSGLPPFRPEVSK